MVRTPPCFFLAVLPATEDAAATEETTYTGRTSRGGRGGPDAQQDHTDDDSICGACGLVHQCIPGAAETVHAHGVVHGDLKPSNWLWDAKKEVPILCDFEPRREWLKDAQGAKFEETAKDHGVGVTLTSKMQSKGFTAPEVEALGDGEARSGPSSGPWECPKGR
eukprot:Skav203756  [mRNA]  locus=scaffold68:651713:653323:+ [translate_table: standard]